MISSQELIPADVKVQAINDWDLFVLVQCGSDQIGYGRKKREIPAELPYDPNKLYEVEMTTVLKVQFAPNHFQPKKGSVVGTFDGIRTNENVALRQRSSAISINALQPLALLFLSLLLPLAFRH
ncbi:ZP domain-containing protein [Trichonephila inaurata madagascariensis]|uniref:ZP domain-containing protein n=1 Tax=Trichonephila inaurata madagascariensis TaxID=2747483 RepID=A0A8X7BUE5_9ARAC|nr:ZP domain-containing protein [Trichonephila inaurata madagascariensis]